MGTQLPATSWIGLLLLPFFALKERFVPALSPGDHVRYMLSHLTFRYGAFLLVTDCLMLSPHTAVSTLSSPTNAAARTICLTMCYVAHLYGEWCICSRQEWHPGRDSYCRGAVRCAATVGIACWIHRSLGTDIV